MSGRALVPIEHQHNLIKLYLYHKLKKQIADARSRFSKMYDQSLCIAARYLDELPESKIIIRLRREIRLATRGTPQTIAESSITSAGYINSGTEQLYNAQSHLVKDAYRKLAPLVHPDRGGDKDLFQLVNTAYKLRDLTGLQDLYVMLVKSRDPYWKYSEDADYYLKTEVERPQVTTQRLRTDPAFQIAMLHRSGKGEDVVKRFAEAQAAVLILQLQSELNYLLNPNRENHGKD